MNTGIVMAISARCPNGASGGTPRIGFEVDNWSTESGGIWLTEDDGAWLLDE